MSRLGGTVTLRRCIVIVIALFIGGFGGYLLFLHLEEPPLFHNVFGQSDHMLFPRWMHDQPDADVFCNSAFIDKRHNLVVLFPSFSDQTYANVDLLTASAEKASFALNDRLDTVIDIWKRENELVIVYDRNAYASTTLPAGMAEKLHNLFRLNERRSLTDVIASSPDMGENLKALVARHNERFSKAQLKRS